ncbi:predicted protein [Naegleria gruberi]|uniref:Predicted protein n=1 Tax=Naegleria gruberi TaxID=5762 RepID=D2VUS5_NAEGR|nr:uncharacterized protein NAEGRDRAFT_81293 [Naegleria gruberi]EFC39379.1 predicted protein [Naegleria gruberi]|eukprot:XP_002672123.1 predicted protein [Naegleria gruberi strain NEG-M]
MSSSIHTISPLFLTPSSAFSNFFSPSRGNTPTSSFCRIDEGGTFERNFNDVFDHLLESTTQIAQSYHHHHHQHHQQQQHDQLLDMVHLFSPSNTELISFDFSSSSCSSSNNTSPLSDESPTLSKRSNLSLTLQVPDVTNSLPKAKKLVTNTLSTTQVKTEKKRKSAPKRKKEEEESICDDEEEDDNCSDLLNQGDRSWKVVQTSEKFAGKLSISITSKTRCEEPCEQVPTKLYSSLKYEIRQQAMLNKNTVKEDLPFLLGRISMVDSQTFEEIQQDNKSNPVLKGVVESALTKKPESKNSKNKETSTCEEYNGVLKVQSSTVSYHHKKINFCWQINYYVPSDLENPIMTLRSAAFKVYARKPSQNKKKKRTTTTSSSQEPPQPIPAVPPSNNLVLNSFEEFENCVEELVGFSMKLTESDRKRSLDLLSTRLLQLDPAYFKQCLDSLHKK